MPSEVFEAQWQGAAYEFIDTTTSPHLPSPTTAGSRMSIETPQSAYTLQLASLRPKTTHITIKTLTVRLEPSQSHLAIMSLIVLGSLGSLLLLRGVA